MNILVCGANGFLGRPIVAALEAAGHTVLCGIRVPGPGASTRPDLSAKARKLVPMDFIRDTAVSTWLPRLEGVQAVVNAVGVLRDGPHTPMQAIHTDVPKALFNACARQGVRRVIHLSALGIASSPSRYATAKRAAEAHLQALTQQGALQGVALQPSIVFGPGGAGCELFTALARWPVMLLPRQAFSARVQPVWIRELAEVVATLAGPAAELCGTLPCVGPEGTPLASFIASLRHQRGQTSAHVLALPGLLARASARLGDAFPFTPWGTQALDLLAQDNTANPQPFAQLLGRPATHYSRLLACLAA
ncbi:NAD-dependent epimerase/dehydratase family protein [Polaromonas naphthalenivorans]|uniref:NAD-dependent epimerase/dehydratase n=1 Tax=Polaromonas naphthalenivorans (strain CJ2) TaxID=365044 RepID=A1VMB7_POLNA|nr:NAD-dependent epimerase/dehydratase family protein [Polaromonas naphthalenivorans]ABM36795.1 NAD-dependent epimerase/dehydratase [Polaromonas naphthalenivorans CJ2]